MRPFVFSCLLLPLLQCHGWAGSGTTILALFEPVSTGTAARQVSAFTDELVGATWQLMNDCDVWDVELLTSEAVTSSALECLGTRAPVWRGKYTRQWKALLNSNELISFGAMGKWINNGDGSQRIRYELWDFVTNHRVATCETTVSESRMAAAELAAQVIGALQLYQGEIVRIGRDTVELGFGPEAVATGTRLLVFAHRSVPHPAGFPAHGHRDDEHHFLGSKIYKRFLGTVPVPPSKDDAEDPEGHRTAEIEVVGFIPMRPPFKQQHAIARIVWGRVLPGSIFSRVTPPNPR